MELSALQKIVNGFTQEKGMSAKIEVRMINITSEVRKLSKEVLKGNELRRKVPHRNSLSLLHVG